MSKLLPPLVLAVVVALGTSYFNSQSSQTEMRMQLSQLSSRAETNFRTNEQQAELHYKTTLQVAGLAKDLEQLAKDVSGLKADVKALETRNR